MSNQRRQRTANPNGEEPRPIPFRVSTDMLRSLLHLAPDVTVTGARIDRATGEVVFTLDCPRAPKNASGLTVQYLRVPGRDTVIARPEWQVSEPVTGEPAPGGDVA